ncbi:MAG: hypothetical protein V2A72_02715 [Candidatus Omnitrophota bacterium]
MTYFLPKPHLSISIKPLGIAEKTIAEDLVTCFGYRQNIGVPAYRQAGRLGKPNEPLNSSAGLSLRYYF